MECRFFAGLSVEETAATLEISPRTVKYDWALARALRGEQVDADFVEIAPFDRPDERRTLLTRATAIRTEDGAIAGAVAASMDLTDQVDTQRALRESEDDLVGGHGARAALLMLGAGDTPALHNPDYDFPDDLIPIGAGILTDAAREILE